MNINDLDLEKLEKEVIFWRRNLHKIPEISLELPKTIAYIKSVLDEIGVEYSTDFSNEASILVTIKGGIKSSKCIALRTDIDALPIKELADFDFKSTNDNMHACGHDAHAAIMLGVVKVLNSVKDKLCGNVKILFQPGEETNKGALPMIEGGALDDVDFILGLHVGSLSDELENGQIGFKEGALMASMDKFQITVEGKASHAASPHISIDPVFIASQIVSALQAVISREVSPLEPAVLSVCMLEAGTAFNIIPKEAKITGTVRTLSKENREYICKRIGEISSGIAKAFRGSVKCEYDFGAPPLINSSDITKKAYESTKKVLGENKVKMMQVPTMVGEDFAFYLEKVPGTYAILRNPLEIDGVVYPHHNGKFALDESAFIMGVKMFVQTVFDYFEE